MCSKLDFGTLVKCEEHLQSRLARAGIYVCSGSSIVIHKIGNSIHSKTHFPALWQGLLI